MNKEYKRTTNKQRKIVPPTPDRLEKDIKVCEKAIKDLEKRVADLESQ